MLLKSQCTNKLRGFQNNKNLDERFEVLMAVKIQAEVF